MISGYLFGQEFVTVEFFQASLSMDLMLFNWMDFVVLCFRVKI